MKKTKYFTRAVLIVLAGLLIGGCSNDLFTASLAKVLSKAEDPQQLWGQLEPHVYLSLPEATVQEEASTADAEISVKPLQLVVMAPGCLGWQSHHERWRNFFLDQGYAVLHVDSFGARSITDLEELDLVVCEGDGVWGFERAGDIGLALSQLADNPNLDMSNIILAGWSHGGWTVWDFLAYLSEDRVPPNLTEWSTINIDTVSTLISFYPYCGFGSMSGVDEIPTRIKGVVFVPELDINVPPEPCIERVKGLQEQGGLIELVTFPKSTHWFDNDQDFEMLPHEYDAEATQAAEEKISCLLKGC